ncbi:MAG: DUF1565 domain-containing protein, partial [Kiritimatiellae bacterium]|nr:DUF1565 domain-containing protein [Kiritimatiellia bacterium]
AQADTGDMILRLDLAQTAGFDCVTNEDVLAGLPPGASAIMIPMGRYASVPIPQVLKDAPGHPYTLVMKIKTRISDGWVSLLNMPDSNDSDAMIYLHKTSRKVCIKQFDKSSNAAQMSSRGVELDRWTTLAFAFDTNSTKIYLDGDVIFSGSGALAGSYADCYLSNDFLVGADNDGDDNDFYLADFRVYDGAVAVGDELLGWGDEDDPFLISSAADWDLFASNVNRGMALGDSYPTYRVTADIGSAAAPITQTVGTDDHPFCGVFEGCSNTIHVAVSGSGTGTALFARIGGSGAYIGDLRVSGSVASSADYAAGLVGMINSDGSAIISHCDISADVTVVGAGHVGGIVGNCRRVDQLILNGCSFSGAISGFNAHAGGLLGWCESLQTFHIADCLFKGYFSPSSSGKYHPIACRDEDSSFSVNLYGKTVYYLNTITPLEDIANIVLEGVPVSATLVQGLWSVPVTAVDGNVYYAQTAIVITPQTDYMQLFNGDVVTGIGGPDTHLVVDDGATVTLRDVCVTNITDDEEHMWGGITCRGDATIIFEGDNALRGGYRAIPGVYVPSGSTLTIRGDGTLAASSNGAGAGIGGGATSGLACGNIVIAGGFITAQGGTSAAGIGSGMRSSCGDITISGGTVTATGGGGAAGIGCGLASTNGNITVTGGIVTATGTTITTDAGSVGGAGIGGTLSSVCSDIAISGGIVIAVGGNGSAGIGGGQSSTNGVITISGGDITATGGLYAAGIGCGFKGTCCAVAISGGTVAATGGSYAPGIGGGARGDCGDVGIEESVTMVTADSGYNAPNSVGTGYEGTCGSVTVGGTETGDIAVSHYVYAPCVLAIASTADWNVFASRVNRGVDSYAGKTVTLTADIAVSTPVGTATNLFCGTFDGAGHVLGVDINGTEVGTAPFFRIDGATIHDLVVTGMVRSSSFHASGLVGACGRSRPNVIRNCTVAVDVFGSGYAGGIVGHGGSSALILEGCVFSGSVRDFSAFAGGLLGWGDAMTLQISDCLSTGTFYPVGGGRFHPIACKFADKTVVATVSNAYYLNAIVPTTMGANIVPNADGVPVSATLVDGEWAEPVVAADGRVYYGWTPGPAGRQIARFTFDDAGNGGLNLLDAAIGEGAVVRATPAASVDGIGNISAVTDADILSGLAAGDGAVAIPGGQYLAVPIPAALLPAAGHPYTVVMKIRVPSSQGWRCLLNMPSSNDSDAMVYLQRTTRNVYLKQFDKSSGSGIASTSGVEADRWTTLAVAFGESTTEIFLDGTRVFSGTGALAGSYADCAAAGGHFLVGADDDGDDGLFYLADFRVYEGAVAVSGALQGSGTPADPYQIHSVSDWNVFAANVGVGVDSSACYRLAANIGPVTTTAGTEGHPFSGTFDGGGHALAVSLNSAEMFTAPFRYVDGAAISNLTVTGSVTSSAFHSAGLVGVCGGNNPNIIRNCTVAANVGGAAYAGGIVGHGGDGSLEIEGCTFSGGISGFANHAGGLVGWCDALELSIRDCLFKGSFSPSDGGKFHPVVCKNGGSAVAAIVERTYYLNTIASSATDGNLVPGADGEPVSATYVFGEWTRAVTAADGIVYYRKSSDVDISSADEWDAFVAGVNSGANTYTGKCVRLIADIGPVTTTVGTVEHPFGGTFDGAGHILAVALSDDSVDCVAPFRVVDGATIRDLTASGSVSAPNYAGGIVGEARGTLLMERCVFSGSIADFTMKAGGLVGWCDDGLAITMIDCLFKGTFVPAAGGTFHPVVCKNPLSVLSVSAARDYYLNTAAPTASEGFHVISGIPVSATFVADEWTRAVTAVDGIVYYRAYHEGLSDDDLLVHFTFDDAGNDGLNLLHAAVGSDAVIRAAPTNLVEGVGEIAAVANPDILAGLPAGDGAVSIPIGQHLAIPIPYALADEPGRTFTVVMKVWFPAENDWRALLSMPASNENDEMLFIRKDSRVACLKQWDGTSFTSPSAVATERWMTIAATFGSGSTHVTIDGKRVLVALGNLAGSRADCSAAGGYFLFGADNNGEDGLVHISDIRIYDGVDPSDFTAELFVDGANGNDANDGLSRGTAFKTIQAAVDVALPGNTVQVAAGTYARVNTSKGPLTIVGAGASETAINGGGSTCATLGNETTLRGFALRNGSIGATGGTLEDCIVESCSAPMSGTDTLRCIVRNCSGGTSKGSVGGGVHRNSLFYGLSFNVIFMDATLYSCTVANNSAPARELYDGPEISAISGELFRGSARYNCVFWDNSHGQAVSSTRAEWQSCPENDNANPLFMDPDKGDYHLCVDSPAIDAGDAAYADEAGGYDLDKNVRVQGAAIDRGCYEGGVDISVTATAVGIGSVSPEQVWAKAPASMTFTAAAGTPVRPIVGWFTNGVLAATGGSTFTLSNVTENIAVTVRFATDDWYVDCANGDDANDGRSSATAMRTLSQAFGTALLDDTIHVAAGTYPPVDYSGPRVTVIGAGAGETIIDGGGSDRCATLSAGTTLRGFTLRNGKDDGQSGCSGVMGGTIEDCVLENCSGLWCGAMRGTDTRRCIVRNVWSGYDSVVGGSHRNTLFYELSGWHSIFTNATLCSCTVANNDATKNFGISLTSRNCIFWGNSFQNDSQDPLFVSAETGDYRLRSGSPAIDAGDAAYAAEAGATDLAGNARVEGAVIDRGCYEGDVSGLVRFTAEVDGFGGTVSPAVLVTNAPATVTFAAESLQSIVRPVDGWFTNGVLAASGGGTFTLADWSDDVAVTVRFAATNLYVDAASGDDGNDGLTTATQFRTIQAAVNASDKRDRIYVAAGTYAPVNASGRGVAVIGAGAGATTIDAGGSGRCALLSGGSTLSGFTLRGGYTGAESEGAAAQGGTLEDCVVEDCHSGSVYSGILWDVDTVRCIVRNCSSSAVWGTIRGGTHRNSLIHSSSAETYFIYEAVLYNCTVANVSASHLSNRPEAAHNCIFWGNPDGNDSVDPMFVSAPDGDYRLRAGSPAIDAGDAAYADEAGETDLAGNARVQGAAIDRGCYEGSGMAGIRFSVTLDGHGSVSPTTAFVSGPADSVLFTADTSVWGLPVVEWYTNGVFAAGAQNTFRVGGAKADVVVTVKFEPGTIYVNGGTGRDSNIGDAASRALRTIQRAIDMSFSGDTIRVSAGTYGSINVGGRELSIVGAGRDATVIDGGRQNPCATLANGTTLTGFTLRNGFSQANWVDEIVSVVGSGVTGGTLVDCTVENCHARKGASIVLNASTLRCIVRNCSAKGFVMYGGEHINALIHGNTSEEIPILYNLWVRSCTIVSNTSGCGEIFEGVMGENCLIWENSTEHGNIADPLFVNPGSGDFHLGWGSPYIDYYTNEVSAAAAAAMYAGDIDLDGNPRVQGSSIDYGCYESPASTAGYPYWSWKWSFGAWNEKGADGIYNVFRYAFDKPVGAFADPPLLGISFDEQGRAVIKT